MSVGARLKEERLGTGMTQVQMGEACGVKKLAQIRFETDVNIPGGSYLMAAAKLGVDVRYVMTGMRANAAAIAWIHRETAARYQALLTQLLDQQFGGRKLTALSDDEIGAVIDAVIGWKAKRAKSA